MFEGQTFDSIMKRMLDRVPIDIDKRQGSIIYDALAPAAAELAQMYIDLDTLLNLVFASTSSGEYLDRIAAAVGLKRHQATPARRKGLFFGQENQPYDVPVGSRYTLEELNYKVLEKIKDGEFLLECETVGSEGNLGFGALVPIETIPGLGKAELVDVVLPGEDTESDAALYRRYLIRVQMAATSGNVHHYKLWALEVPGVGEARVFPLWDGRPGTVKVVIADTNKEPASPGLIEETYNYIESVRPIGARLTVVSGQPKEVNISATVSLAVGYNLQAVQDEFIKILTEYLRAAAFNVNYISCAQVGSLLLSTPGVVDHSNLQLNGDGNKVVLGDEAIPILGTVTLEV